MAANGRYDAVWPFSFHVHYGLLICLPPCLSTRPKSGPFPAAQMPAARTRTASVLLGGAEIGFLGMRAGTGSKGGCGLRLLYFIQREQTQDAP